MTESSCLVYERVRGDYRIRCTQKQLDPLIAEFVARMYYQKFNFTITCEELLKTLQREDELFIDTSLVFTIYDAQDEILATAKMIHFSGGVMLPIQKEFNVDLAGLSAKMAPVAEIWEVVRLATRGNQVEALKLLLKEGIYNCSGKDDMIVACIDRRVLLGLRRLGFPFVELGAAKQYLGSLTCPAAYSIRDLSGEFCCDELHKD